MVRKIKKKKLSKSIASKASSFKVIAFLGFLTLATGVTYFLTTQQQDIRQRASSALINCDVADMSLDAEELEFLRLINEYRTQNGLNTLTMNEELTRATHWKSKDMADNRYFSHTDSLRRAPATLAQNCGFPAGAHEIITAGVNMDRAAEAISSYKRSSSHNKAMLFPTNSVIAISRHYDKDSVYRWYWSVMLSPLTNTPTPTHTPTKTPSPSPTKTPTPLPTRASSTPTTAPTTTTSLKGDANGDGKITFNDYRQVINCQYKSTAECKPSDVDGNGSVEPADLNALLKIFYSL